MTSAEEMRSQAVSPVSTLGRAGADSAASAAFAITRPSIGNGKNTLFICYALLQIVGFGLRRKLSVIPLFHYSSCFLPAYAEDHGLCP
jgi:hypothetical protein